MITTYTGSPLVTSEGCPDLGLASGVALTMVRSGTGEPSTESIVLLTIVIAASVTDLMLAIAFTFVALPGGLTELWLHVTTLTMEAIIIPVTAILLRDDLDSVFSTLTIYLVLSGTSTLMNFGVSMHALRASMREFRPLQSMMLLAQFPCRSICGLCAGAELVASIAGQLQQTGERITLWWG